MHLVVIIVAIVLSETLAQYYIKQYHEIPSKYYYIMGLGFYASVAYFLNKSYDHTTMGQTQVIWSGLSCISVLMVGRYFFGEKVDANEWIGMSLILLGIAITQMKKNMWLTKNLKKEFNSIFS